MTKPAAVHPQPSPWRQPHDRGQPERISPWRDPDERVYLSAFWSWRLHAACRGVDTELFYAPESERGGLAPHVSGRPKRSVPPAW
jgi:hypothetical protein